MYLRMSDVSEMARCFGGCLVCLRVLLCYFQFPHSCVFISCVFRFHANYHHQYFPIFVEDFSFLIYSALATQQIITK